jgi:class 3 adenylate cyclase
METESDNAPEFEDALAVMRTQDFQTWVAQNCWNAYPSIALVFTDIVGSTTLLYQVGDDAYDAILTIHFKRARELIASFKGREINTAGDGILCAFLQVSEAVGFARELAASPGSDQVQIRAGIHFGNVKFRLSDMCGKNIHFASRVMSQAIGPETWLSDDAKKRLEDEDREFFAQLHFTDQTGCKLKNMPGEHRLWRLSSQEPKTPSEQSAAADSPREYVASKPDVKPA